MDGRRSGCTAMLTVEARRRRLLCPCSRSGAVVGSAESGMAGGCSLGAGCCQSTVSRLLCTADVAGCCSPRDLLQQVKSNLCALHTQAHFTFTRSSFERHTACPHQPADRRLYNQLACRSFLCVNRHAGRHRCAPGSTFPEHSRPAFSQASWPHNLRSACAESPRRLH